MTDRKMWKTGLSVGRLYETSLERAARAGLDLLEISCIQNDDVTLWKKVPQWEQEAGVKVWSLHLPFWIPGNGVVDPATWDEALWKKTYDIDADYINHCGEAGIRHIVIHPALEPTKPEERETRTLAAIEHLGVLSDLCKKNGCILCVEDLPRTCLGNTSDEMLRFMESNSDLRICFDVNHLLYENHGEFVRKVGKYIVTTHISDYDFADERHQFPMEGQINWRMLQSALELADYTGPFMYETMPLGRTWEDVKPNHEYLKNL